MKVTKIKEMIISQESSLLLNKLSLSASKGMWNGKIFHSDMRVQRLQNHSNVKNVIKLCVHQDVRRLKSKGSIQEVNKSCSRRATLTHPLVRSNLPTCFVSRWMLTGVWFNRHWAKVNSGSVSFHLWLMNCMLFFCFVLCCFVFFLFRFFFWQDAFEFFSNLTDQLDEILKVSCFSFPLWLVIIFFS